MCGTKLGLGSLFKLYFPRLANAQLHVAMAMLFETMRGKSNCSITAQRMRLKGPRFGHGCARKESDRQVGASH